MQSVQFILDDAPENIPVPDSLRHLKVEVTFKELDVTDTETILYNQEAVDSICGVLHAPHSVSLDQMDKAVKQRGSSL